MIDLLLSLVSGGGGLLLGLGGILAALVVAFFKGRSGGVAKERAKQAEREQKARDIAGKIDNDVGAIPPGEARKELGKWSKP